jgi:hypothetical protein
MLVDASLEQVRVILQGMRGMAKEGGKGTLTQAERPALHLYP